MDASARVEFLEADKVDVILANFTVTDERAEKVDFANPYMQVSLGVVSPVSSEITEADRLADKSLIIVRGTTAESIWMPTTPMPMSRSTSSTPRPQTRSSMDAPMPG